MGFIFNDDWKKALNILEQTIEHKNRVIETLRDNNKHLQDENYKDEELARMKKELEAERKAKANGFEIWEDEWKAIKAWQDEHELGFHKNTSGFPRGGAIGGCYKYEFVPTSIGIFGTVKCNCGAKFDFRDDL